MTNIFLPKGIKANSLTKYFVKYKSEVQKLMLGKDELRFKRLAGFKPIG